MTCPNKIVIKPCAMSGEGYTAQPMMRGQNQIQLMQGHGAGFPSVSSGQFYYVEVSSSCGTCCEVMQVVGKNADVLTVVRTAGTACDCIESNATVTYTLSTYDAILAIAGEAPFNVASPLVFDCETRTLSIDCEAFSNSDCGCGGGAVAPSMKGEKGADGEQGPPGLSVIGTNVDGDNNLFITLSDGTVLNAGKINTIKGDPGVQGPPGGVGPPGSSGSSAPYLISGAMDGDDMVLSLSNGETIRVKDARGRPGADGADGEDGKDGQNGQNGQNGISRPGMFMYLANKEGHGMATVVGPPGEEAYLLTGALGNVETHFTISGNGRALVPNVIHQSGFTLIYQNGIAVGGGVVNTTSGSGGG